ncbi:MAG: AAA family ATPase, partial [Candidatus Acidiferrales bacterium]
MLVDLTIKNYRCFSDTEPARIQLRKGFTGLIGVNNCGKSSLLRFFYEFRKLFDLLSRSDNNFISVVAANAIAFGPPDNVLDLQEMFSNANVRDIELQFLFIPEPGDQEQRKFTAKVIVRRPTNTFQFELFMEGRSLRGMGFNPSTQAVFAGGQPANHVATLSFLFDAFSTLANTLYIGPFRNAINIGTNSNYFDMPTGQSFISTWRARKTGKSKIMQEDILRLTEDIRRIFGFRQLEINSTDDNLTMQLYIDGKSYFLPELGSGVAHFILVLAGAAFEKPSYILIDEPEMGLHPSLQLDFLTTLHSYAREGVIFSTHSIGLAKASAERIYSLRKKDDGTTQLKEFGTTARLSEFLGEL